MCKYKKAVITGTHNLHNILLKVPTFCQFSNFSEYQDNRPIKKYSQENGICMWVGWCDWKGVCQNMPGKTEILRGWDTLENGQWTWNGSGKWTWELLPEMSLLRNINYLLQWMHSLLCPCNTYVLVYPVDTMYVIYFVQCRFSLCSLFVSQKGIQ